MNSVYAKKRPEDLNVGDFALFPKTVSASDVMMFCGNTGDLSPVYVNQVFGRESRFQGQVVPPMLLASMLGGAVYRLLSPDSFPLQRSFEVVKPVFAGDTVTCRAEVQEKNEETRQVTLRLEVFNSANELVLKGQSVETMDVRE